MTNFAIKVIVGLFADPKFQAFVLTLVDRFAVLMFPKLAAIVPASVGAAVKTAIDELVEKIPGVTGTVDVVKATESAASGITDILENLPVIGDVFKDVGL